MVATFLAVLTAASLAKGPCADYFGSVVNDPTALVTVADPDVTEGFPKGTRTFVHHSGLLHSTLHVSIHFKTSALKRCNFNQVPDRCAYRRVRLKDVIGN